MSDLISRSKIRDYIKTQINPYGKPFEGTPYELGLKIMKYIDGMHPAYDVEKVVDDVREDCYSMGFDESQTEIIIKDIRKGGVRE